jgi:hypothetical protein
MIIIVRSAATAGAVKERINLMISFNANQKEPLVNNNPFFDKLPRQALCSVDNG